MWEKGEGGRIAQTLATGLLLPDDVHAFKEGTEESVGRRLQWHTIAVTPFSSITYHPLHFVAILTFVFVRLRNWPIFWVTMQSYCRGEEQSIGGEEVHRTLGQVPSRMKQMSSWLRRSA